MLKPEMPRHFSYSAAETFDGCPSKWEAIYVLRQKDPPGIEAAIGTFAHAVLEGVMALPSEERTLASARRVALELWPDQKAADAAPFVVDAKSEAHFRRVAWMGVTRLFKVETPESVSIEGLELKLDTIINGVPFVGYIDRLERDWLGELSVADYKFGKMPSLYFREPKDRQIQLYAAGVKAQLGKRPTTGKILWLGVKTPKVWTVDVSDRAVDAATVWLGQRWSALSAAVEANHFDRTPTALCGWCPALPSCPEGQTSVADRMAEGKNVGPGEAVLRDLVATPG